MVLTHNRVDLLRKCVENVLLRTSGETREIVIWDNGSTDGTAEYLGSLDDPRLRVLRSETNVGHNGYARAFRETTAPYMVELDDDVVNAPPGWDATLRAAFDRLPSIGFLAADLEDDPNDEASQWRHRIRAHEYTLVEENGVRLLTGPAGGGCAITSRALSDRVGRLPRAPEGGLLDRGRRLHRGDRAHRLQGGGAGGPQGPPHRRLLLHAGVKGEGRALEALLGEARTARCREANARPHPVRPHSQRALRLVRRALLSAGARRRRRRPEPWVRELPRGGVGTSPPAAPTLRRMDLAQHAAVLWRFRAVVTGGLVLGIVLAVLAAYQLPSMTPRGSETWSSESSLLVTQAGFPEGRSTLPTDGTGEVGGGTGSGGQSGQLEFADPDRLSGARQPLRAARHRRPRPRAAARATPRPPRSRPFRGGQRQHPASGDQAHHLRGQRAAGLGR